jgi:hypothetical protein
MMNPADVRANKRQSALPIGQTARIAYEIETMRAACCKAAQLIASQPDANIDELDECARLDEALAQAHRLLKHTVRQVMLSRLSRRSKTR